MNLQHRLLMTAGATALLVASLGGPAVAAPTSNGCPASYELHSVQELVALGYGLPPEVDDPDSGVLTFNHFAGNGDGYICTKPYKDYITDFGQPALIFQDNFLPVP